MCGSAPHILARARGRKELVSRVPSSGARAAGWEATASWWRILRSVKAAAGRCHQSCTWHVRTCPADPGACARSLPLPRTGGMHICHAGCFSALAGQQAWRREERGQRREERGWQAPGTGLEAARGSMRASGRASAAACSRHLAQLRPRRQLRHAMQGREFWVPNLGVEPRTALRPDPDAWVLMKWFRTTLIRIHRWMPLGCLNPPKIRGSHCKVLPTASSMARGGGAAEGGRHPDQSSGQPGAGPSTQASGSGLRAARGSQNEDFIFLTAG